MIPTYDILFRRPAFPEFAVTAEMVTERVNKGDTAEEALGQLLDAWGSTDDRTINLFYLTQFDELYASKTVPMESFVDRFSERFVQLMRSPSSTKDFLIDFFSYMKRLLLNAFPADILLRHHFFHYSLSCIVENVLDEDLQLLSLSVNNLLAQRATDYSMLFINTNCNYVCQILDLRNDDMLSELLVFFSILLRRHGEPVADLLQEFCLVDKIIEVVAQSREADIIASFISLLSLLCSYNNIQQYFFNDQFLTRSLREIISHVSDDLPDGIDAYYKRLITCH